MIVNFFKKYNNEKIKRGFLRDYIPNIGKVVEEDDRFVCYVSEGKMNRELRTKTYYNLQCVGVITKNHNPLLMEELHLTKPVYYIFDGITFDRPVRVSGTHCNIIFKNCTFMNEIHISKADSITLESNHYVDTSVSHENTFLSGKITSLTMLNESFTNDYNNITNKFGVDINTDELFMQGTTIVAEKPKGNVTIKSKNIIMENSIIYAPEIFIETNRFNMSNNSSLVADKSILVEASNVENTYNFLAPLIIYNGVEFINNKSTPKIILNKEKLELQQKRKELIDALRNLRDKRMVEEKENENQIVRKR